MTGTQKSQKRKQMPLRISQALYDELEVWADEEFRSVNSQIEAILSNCVKQRMSEADKYQTQ